MKTRINKVTYKSGRTEYLAQEYKKFSLENENEKYIIIFYLMTLGIGFIAHFIVEPRWINIDRVYDQTNIQSAKEAILEHVAEKDVRLAFEMSRRKDRTIESSTKIKFP